VVTFFVPIFFYITRPMSKIMIKDCKCWFALKTYATEEEITMFPRVAAIAYYCGHCSSYVTYEEISNTSRAAIFRELLDLLMRLIVPIRSCYN
jgi:hypothetical protein